ncbi:helix-turn-helix transcriptional regulator [Nonomuraea sp. NPDC050404]|uniref:helix-turn-helix domain-containing protein n=1 Tax=Nonomuraea sp. NPDC050404 TaxID=3155783 RepID=UPI0033FE7294
MPLATRLKRLREVMVNPNTGLPYSQRDVAAAITAAGTPMTGSYIALLEGGDRAKISLDKAIGLAKFYGVPVEYLSENPDQDLVKQVSSQLDLFEAMLKSGAVQMRFRQAGELSPEARQRITRIIRQEMENEGIAYEPGI